MKRCFWGLLTVLLSWEVCVFGAGRIFTDAKGRSIEAELIRYSEPKNEITIKRVGMRKEMTVSISAFSSKDQDYIREWGRLQALHDSRFKADIRRKNKQDADKSYGTSASTQVYTDHTFNVVFKNGTTTALEDLELEYVIFYEQERHLRGARKVELREGSFYKKDTISLPMRQDTEYETEKVTLYTWNTYSLAPIDAKVRGIRLRLTMKTPSGETTTREFCYPSSLKNQWTSETVNAQRR